MVAQPALSAAEWACRVRDNCSRHGCLYRESGRAFLFVRVGNVEPPTPNVQRRIGCCSGRRVACIQMLRSQPTPSLRPRYGAAGGCLYRRNHAKALIAAVFA